MGEPSFRRGFSAGCGLITALFTVFVVLPIGACIFFGMLGSGSAGSTASTAPAPNDFRDAPLGGETTDCGRLIEGRDAVGNPRAPDWTAWACLDEHDVGERWTSCLGRPSYSSSRGGGCPGAQRCCPPAELPAPGLR